MCGLILWFLSVSYIGILVFYQFRPRVDLFPHDCFPDEGVQTGPQAEIFIALVEVFFFMFIFVCEFVKI